MAFHRSTAYFARIEDRGGWKPSPITPQARFLIRLAVACHSEGIPYDVEWKPMGKLTAATIMTEGNVIPMPRALPKAPREKPIDDWKPKFHEAVYKLNAWTHDGAERPGFEIAHSCGLSLVCPSDTGEWGDASGDADPNGADWRVTHTQSGAGFGISLSLKRAIPALLSVATMVDWTLTVDELRKLPAFRRAGATFKAAYGASHVRAMAKDQLERLELAA